MGFWLRVPDLEGGLPLSGQAGRTHHRLQPAFLARQHRPPRSPGQGKPLAVPQTYCPPSAAPHLLAHHAGPTPPRFPGPSLWVRDHAVPSVLLPVPPASNLSQTWGTPSEAARGWLVSGAGEKQGTSTQARTRLTCWLWAPILATSAPKKGGKINL